VPKQNGVTSTAPWKLRWNLKIIPLKRKIIFQHHHVLGSMLVFGCVLKQDGQSKTPSNSSKHLGYKIPSQSSIFSGFSKWLSPCDFLKPASCLPWLQLRTQLFTDSLKQQAMNSTGQWSTPNFYKVCRNLGMPGFMPSWLLMDPCKVMNSLRGPDLSWKSSIAFEGLQTPLGRHKWNSHRFDLFSLKIQQRPNRPSMVGKT